MAELRCEHCGTFVIVRGVAAVCPNCKELVTAPPSSTTVRASDSTVLGNAAATRSTDPPSGSSTLNIPASIPAEASSLPAPPMPAPPPSRQASVWKIVGVTLLVLLGFTLLVDYLRLRLRPPTVVQVVAPNPSQVQPQLPSRRSPGPRDGRASIFQEQPPPPSTRSNDAAARATEPPRVAESPTPVPAQPAKPAHPFAHIANLRPQIPQHRTADRISDEQIGRSIERGVEFLLAQFSKTRLKGADNYDPETFAGLNALCVYALLHAGQAISDERLNVQNDQMKSLIERMKEFAMEGNRATYSRALRISALSVYDRAEDRSALEKDAQWLLGSTLEGAYTYSKPQPGSGRSQGGWDNSNSQYGALGIWAAAEAGFRAPSSFWQSVESHWSDAQTHSGGWGYGPGAQGATIAMTAAGVTSLFIAREQLGTQPNAPESGPLSRTILRGLEWLDEGDNSVSINAHPGYTLYGLERAGLASGYKFFGKHDWYLELAARAIADQRDDGSWEGGDGVLAETAFNLLFLSRGRHPIFVSKLRFEGNWANRPRDIANLTRFAGRELERPLNWQTVGLEREWTEWTDAPVLFIASDQPPNFSNSDIEKLRAYVEAGGMIFTHADKNSAPFTRYVESLAPRLFPNYPLRAIPEDHRVFSVMFPQSSHQPFLGVSNGSRLLMVHSPNDLAKAWTVRPLKSNRPQYEAAINVIVYAAGRREFRNRLNSIHVAPPSEQPIGIVPVARLRYDGNWDPEPGAWTRFARMLQNQTGLTVAPAPIKIDDLTYDIAPIAHLTGTDPLSFTEPQIDALRQFVASGGILLIDACGGSGPFFESIHKNLLPKLFPASPLQPLDETHALLRGKGDAMDDLTKPRFRPFAIETRGRTPGQLMWFQAGRGAVILSDLDLTSGLLGTGAWGIAGYQPAYAEGVVRNLVLWTISRIPS